jgi:hypothetical protein
MLAGASGPPQQQAQIRSNTVHRMKGQLDRTTQLGERR